MRGPGRTPEHRVVGIDVLRAVAVLLVMLIHWQGAKLFAKVSEPADMLAWILARGGGYGVILFFVISGFVITRSVMNRREGLFRMIPARFYLRRAARIQPLFVASLLLGITFLTLEPRGPVHAFVFNAGNRFTAEFWVSVGTFWFNIERILQPADRMYWGLHWDVLWSLAVEEQFYLGFPLLVLLTGSTKRLAIALFVIIAVGLVARPILSAGLYDPVPVVYNSLCCFDVLALGVLCALYGERFQPSRCAMICIVFAATGWVVAALTFRLQPSLVPTVALAGALFILCAQTGRIFTGPIWRPIAWVGRLSYGMYLLHPIVLYLASPLLAGLPFLLGYLVFVAPTILLAALSHALIERPAGEWMSRLRLPWRPTLAKA